MWSSTSSAAASTLSLEEARDIFLASEVGLRTEATRSCAIWQGHRGPGKAWEESLLSSKAWRRGGTTWTVKVGLIVVVVEVTSSVLGGGRVVLHVG